MRWIVCTLILVSAVNISVQAAAGGGELRLVATHGGQEFDRVDSLNGTIRAQTQNGYLPLQTRVEWRLEGDLLAQGPLFDYAPSYSIVGPLHVMQSGDSGGTHQANVAVEVVPGRGWTASQMEGGVIVVAWIADGQPTQVAAAPAAVDDNLPAAVFLLSLDDDSRRGAPVVLLAKGGEFIAPIPPFRDHLTARAVAAMHFGTNQAFDLALAIVENVNRRGQHRTTLLHVAAEGGFAQAVAYLLARGAELDARDLHRILPVDYAAAKGRTACVQQLVSAGALKKLSRAEISKICSRTASSGHNEAATVLIEASNTWGAADFPATFLAANAAVQGDLETLDRIVAAWGNQHLKRLWPGVISACIKRGDFATMRWLLERGVSPQPSEWEADLPLHVAAVEGKVEVFEALFKAGASVHAQDERHQTPLLKAAQHGQADAVHALLRAQADPDSMDSAGNSALHHAVHSRDSRSILSLLEHKAALDLRDAAERTAFELALQLQAKTEAEILFRAGARMNVRAPDFEKTLSGAIALDFVDALAAATADGWDPALPVLGTWMPARIAKLYAAHKVQAWLDGNKAPATGPAIERVEELATAPRLMARPYPLDRRFPRESTNDAEVVLVAVLNLDGRLMFPKISTNASPVLQSSILESLEAWQLEPALREGEAVHTIVAFRLGFPSPSDRVFSPAEVDLPPQLLRADLPPGEHPKSVFVANPIVQADLVRPSTSPSILFYDGAPEPYIEVPNPEAFRQKVALVSLIVERNGDAAHIIFLRFSDEKVQAKISSLLRTAKFQPAVRDGAAVRSRILMPFSRR